MEKCLSDEILKEFERYLIDRGIYANYKHHICRVKKYLPVLIRNEDKIMELNFSYRTLSGIVTAIKYFQEFLFDRYGIELPINIARMREIIKLKNRPKINFFDFLDTEIIDDAISTLRNSKNFGLKTRIYLLTLFFTGLRASEVNYFLNNFFGLRNVEYKSVAIFELNYDRRSKKAYLTMLPVKLKRGIEKILKSFKFKFSYVLRDEINRKGIKTYIFRKSFVAIASNTMMEHEINLLQGRIGSILIKHYVRHIKEIAEKYKKAFEKYEYLIDEILD